jgi:hypothetical protein
LHRLTAHKVRLNNLVDISLVHVGVPNGFRVDHRNRPTRASIKTARLVDAYAAGAVQACRLHSGLAVIKGLLRTMLSAASLISLALIETKENVSFEVARRHEAIVGRSPGQDRLASLSTNQPRVT